MSRRRPDSAQYVRRRTASYCDSEYQVQNRRTYYTRPDTPFRCHQLAESLLSTSSGFNNYRGFLNLGMILLALSTGRVALENVLKYGILIDPFMWIGVFLSDPYSWPSFCLILLTNVFILICFAVELLLSGDRISELTGSIIHALNLFSAITFPALVVLYVQPSPLTSSPTLAMYIVVFLKLISYKHVNKMCREYYSVSEVADKLKPALRRVQSYSHTARGHGTATTSTDQGACNAAQLKCGQSSRLDDPYTAKTEPAVDHVQTYPQNVNLRDMYYFMLAPTLCYELNFPRSTRIRKRFLIKRLIEMVFLCGLMLSLIQQWIIPTVNNSMVPFKELQFTAIVERLMKLAIPNHLIWLIFFYWLFHSCMNVFAELLRFGDRTFYKDWWNAETIQVFWQTWNIPVHKWALRHVYKPMVSRGYSRMSANVIVFLISAFFHEYLVSIPLCMFRLWSFTGLISQIPLAMITQHWLRGSQFGNVIVWVSLIIGQPVAILMYYHDYYIMSNPA